mmetsp:Transcript_40293/g.110926  ORF Transcript_40293/g.110926 Transcript_40293/m.110926 type:complete len:296 (-) Transcript_40293:1109-1996(-)
MLRATIKHQIERFNRPTRQHAPSRGNGSVLHDVERVRDQHLHQRLREAQGAAPASSSSLRSTAHVASGSPISPFSSSGSAAPAPASPLPPSSAPLAAPVAPSVVPPAVPFALTPASAAPSRVAAGAGVPVAGAPLAAGKAWFSHHSALKGSSVFRASSFSALRWSRKVTKACSVLAWPSVPTCQRISCTCSSAASNFWSSSRSLSCVQPSTMPTHTTRGRKSSVYFHSPLALLFFFGVEPWSPAAPPSSAFSVGQVLKLPIASIFAFIEVSMALSASFLASVTPSPLSFAMMTFN